MTGGVKVEVLTLEQATALFEERCAVLGLTTDEFVDRYRVEGICGLSSMNEQAALGAMWLAERGQHE